jgi:hypothetical protein
MSANHHHQEVTCPQNIFRDRALKKPIRKGDEHGWTLWGEVSTRVVPVGPHRIWTPAALIGNPALSRIFGTVTA